MTDPTPPAGAATARRGFPWLKTLLIGSLALNLLLVGGAAARYFTHERPERITGLSNMQMIPRRFFAELDGGRRAELLAVFKDFRGEFRDGRKTAREQMGNLASALEADPYDANAVRTAVTSFTDSGAALMRHGGDAALAFIARLTPEERKLLARHIRLRDMGGRSRGDGPDEQH